MFHQIIRKLGVVRTTLLLTALTTIISVSLTVVILLIAGQYDMRLGIMIATSAAVVITPPVAFIVLRLLAQVDQAEQKHAQLVAELQEALATAKTLSGLLPICASCKKIRDDEGYWHQVEVYVRDHSEADFSHGTCPECAEKLYIELAEMRRRKEEKSVHWD